MKIDLSVGEFLGLLTGIGILAAANTKRIGARDMTDIKETDELVKAVVAIAKAAKQAKESNGGYDTSDFTLLLGVLPALKDGVLGLDKIPGELKELDQAEIAKLAGEAMGGFDVEGKTKLYVEKALVIISAIYDIVKA